MQQFYQNNSYHNSIEMNDFTQESICKKSF